MDVEKSNVIQKKFKFGRRPYTELRGFLLPYIELASAKKTREFRKKYEPALDDCHGNGVWAPLRDVFGRVTKSILENLVDLGTDLQKKIEMGMIVRATCGFDGVSEKMSCKQYKIFPYICRYFPYIEILYSYIAQR